ncbi:hypothetical protein Scep_011638 [Stephania cephalantha]|uniref:Uncharacterized protein n=1 Tax=Stephania cephalantha TaxID=152367 RepID=A0AAP0JEI6_9MAGN
MLSKTFFSMCMTSKLWRIKFVFQYGKSQNMLFFLHPEFLAIRPFTDSAPISVTFIKPNDSISAKISSPDGKAGGSSFMTILPLMKFFLSFLNGDDFSKKRR